MILLKPGVNEINLTLSEKSKLSNPDYVLIFQNDNTGERFAVTNSYTNIDIGISVFSFDVKSSPNWLIGEVQLSKYGFYHYSAYECPDASILNYNSIITSNDLVPTYFTTLVETGKMKFERSNEVQYNYYKNHIEPVKAYGE